MPAGVFESRDRAVGATVNHEVASADRPGSQRALNFVAPGNWIPGVQRKGLAARHRCPPDPTAPSLAAQSISLFYVPVLPCTQAPTSTESRFCRFVVTPKRPLLFDGRALG